MIQFVIIVLNKEVLIMYIYIGICAVIVIVAIIFAIYVSNYNKFQVSIIKISAAEENINILLKKKFELIVRINNFIEEKKTESKMIGLDGLEKKNLNNFELNTELDKYNKKIIEITDYSKEIIFDDDEEKILKELSLVNIELLAAQRYYNDNVVKYNELIKCFPSNLVSRLCKYKIKNFYSNEKEEIFEILKK